MHGRLTTCARERYSRCGRQRVEINGHQCLGKEHVELPGAHVGGIHSEERRGEIQGHRTLLIRGGESQDKARKIMRGQGMIMIDEAKDDVTKA
jgi:hypothetical protein